MRASGCRAGIRSDRRFRHQHRPFAYREPAGTCGRKSLRWRWGCGCLVPAELALLYDFVNSLDLRQYTEKGKQHEGHDELATAGQLEGWMRDRGLLDARAHVSAPAHRMALRLRVAIRDYLQLAPQDRSAQSKSIVQLNELSSSFPLTVGASRGGRITLDPAPGSSALARVLAEMYLLS